VASKAITASNKEVAMCGVGILYYHSHQHQIVGK